MKALVFPGQGAQFVGMGKDLHESSDLAKELFHKADEVLGFEISKIMFEGTEEDLRATKVTQPAVFLHSVITLLVKGSDLKADVVAGHSLGEFSALVANKTLNFESALTLVSKRALAMQKACEINPSTMAAVLGMEDEKVEEICASISEGVVVAANYNCPGQLVISGDNKAIDLACSKLTEAGAKRALKLSVGGAFHSPLMQPAAEELKTAIEQTDFKNPTCPIVQNVNAKATNNPDEIKKNLIDQLTAPVRWTQSVETMLAMGTTDFIEIGPGKVLQGLIKKIDRTTNTSSL